MVCAIAGRIGKSALPGARAIRPAATHFFPNSQPPVDMPEESTSPTTIPTEPAKTKRTRGPINQALVEELTLAGQLATTAEKPEYAAALADEGIDAAFLTALRAAIAEADALVGGATGKSAGKKAVTRQEETLKDALLAELAKIQTRAKRKYQRAGDPNREKYFIGERIGSNRALLERATRAILENLKTDELPGLKPADVTALTAALDAYVGIQSEQSGGQSGATTDRALLEAKVKTVADQRRELQYVADLLWPASKKANAGIHTEFGLPSNKALK